MPAPATPPKPLPHSLTKSAFAGWRLLGSVDPFPADADALRLEWAADVASGLFDWETLVTIDAPPEGSTPEGTTAATYAVPWTYNQQPPGGQAGGVIRLRFVASNAEGDTPGPALLWAYSRAFFDPTDPAGQRGVVMRFLDVAPPGTVGVGVGASSLMLALLEPAAITDAMVRSNGQLIEVLPLDAPAPGDGVPLLHVLPVAGTAPRELRLRRVTLLNRNGSQGYGSLFCFSDALAVVPPAADPVLVPGVETTLAATFVGAGEGAPGWELTDGQGYTAYAREALAAPDGWSVALTRAPGTGLALFTVIPPSDRLSFDALSLRRLDTGESVRFGVAEGEVANEGGWGQIRRFLVTPGGEPDIDPPAPPGELEMVLQGHTFLDLRHKPMPARGRQLRVQRLGGAGWETLPGVATVGGALVTLSELTPRTLYVLRSLAVNTVGQTPGPEQHVYTLGSAPIGPPKKPGPPVLVARTPESATIGQSAWQTDQTAMRLYRNGRLLHVFTATGQNFLDITARHGDIYELVAVARAGNSEYSDPLTLNLRSSHTITIVVPVAGATLAGAFEIVFTANVPLTRPSVTLGGLSKAAVIENGITGLRYRASGNTINFVAGPRIIIARGLDPLGFPVEASVAVVLVNDASSSTKYLSVFDEADNQGMNLGRVNAGVRSGRLSPSVYRRFWMQARLVSTGMEGVSADWEPDSLTREQLTALWEKGQPVALELGALTPIVGADAQGRGGVGGSRWYFKHHQGVSKPGEVVYLLLRQTPVQTLFWLDTERDVVVSIKDLDETSLGVLGRNIEPNAPGAALWRFSVDPVGGGTGGGTGGGDALFSVPVWELVCDLDAHAPDAFDWALVAKKLYVLRDGASAVRVIDLDTGEEVLDINLPGVPVPPRFIERIGGKVLVICASAVRTVAFDLSFPAPKVLWEVAWGASACAVFDGGLLLARANRVYHSPGGTGAPVLLNGAAASDIVTISRDPIIESGTGANAPGATAKLATFVRGVDGQIHQVSVASGVATLPALTLNDGGVSGVGTWIGALDVRHGLAVSNPVTAGQDTAPARVYEQGADGAWYPGDLLEPPGDQAAPTVATAVKGFSFELRAAQGSITSPGYVPPLIDWKMLIGTGTTGLVAVLEQARLGAADGAVLSGAVEHVYVQGLESPKPVTPPSTGTGGGSGSGSGSGSGGSPGGV